VRRVGQRIDIFFVLRPLFFYVRSLLGG